ncbi:MAG TPA: hypothetical protein VIL86_12255 [Tepidisphaeraceae bacterium]
MRPPSPILARFINSVHRRLLLVRMLEWTGIGLAAGAAVALILMTILISRDQPILPLGLAALSLGAAWGAIWAIIRRPSHLDAAIQADRQLGLSDLLSTAATISADDPFGQAVLHMAESRCAKLSPSAVIAHRLGARAWGGIGLAAALVLTVGITFSTASISPTNASDRGFLSPAELAMTRSEKIEPTPTRRFPRTPADQPSENSPDASRLGTGSAQPNPAKTENPTDSASARGHSTSTEGAGGGESHGADQHPNTATPPDQGTSAAHSNNGGAIVSGAGQATDSGTPGTSSSAAAGAPDRPHRAAPWSASAWPAARAAAGDALRQGAVPDAYRDLVRDYFAKE